MINNFKWYISLLYLVYKDLHGKGYYILPGNKYGVDFLGYKDDPNFVHSTYLISCKNINENISTKDIINNERISFGTKKILIFVYAQTLETNRIIITFSQPRIEKLIYVFVDKNENENKNNFKINYINLSWTQI